MARTITEEIIPARMPTAMYEQLLEEEQLIRLSAAASEELFHIMENPPEPNEYLKRAMQRHEEMVCRQ